jgi:hypothetical protein
LDDLELLRHIKVSKLLKFLMPLKVVVHSERVRIRMRIRVRVRVRVRVRGSGNA